MKQKINTMVCLLAWLCLQCPMAVCADSFDNSSDVNSFAQAIVDGQRPPLSADELNSLSMNDKQRLADALTRCRQDLADQAKQDPVLPAKAPSSHAVSPSGVTSRSSQLTEDQLPVLDHDKEAFIAYFAPLAKKIGNKFDLYPSIIIAQAILESNWGTSSLYRQFHNPMGVKGRGITLPTLEEEAQRLRPVNASFRAYNSVQDALEDYGQIMQDSLYRHAHRSQSANYQQATANLKGKYATDSNYDQKLNLLIIHYHLDQFDHQDQPVRHHTTAPANSKADTTYAEPRQKKQLNQHHDTRIAWQWPLAGGAGSVGILEIARRLMK